MSVCISFLSGVIYFLVIELVIIIVKSGFQFVEITFGKNRVRKVL